MRIAVCAMKKCMKVITSPIVNSNVVEICMLSAWKDGLSIRFQRVNKLLAHYAGQIGVEMP